MTEILPACGAGFFRANFLGIFAESLTAVMVGGRWMA